MYLETGLLGNCWSWRGRDNYGQLLDNYWTTIIDHSYEETLFFMSSRIQKMPEPTWLILSVVLERSGSQPNSPPPLGQGPLWILLAQRNILLLLRAIFVLRIFRLRTFESKFRSHCAKKLNVHEESPPPSFKNSFGSNSNFEDS